MAIKTSLHVSKLLVKLQLHDHVLEVPALADSDHQDEEHKADSIPQQPSLVLYTTMNRSLSCRIYHTYITTHQRINITTWFTTNWCHKSVEGRLAIGYGGQFHFSGRPHNPTSRFWSSPMSVVAAESFSDRPGPLKCVPQEMGFHWQRTMWLWRNPDNVTHHQLLSIGQILRWSALTWSRWAWQHMALSTW